MCVACDELSKVWDASQELMVSRINNRKTGKPTFIIVQGNERPESVILEVNFCPWCGKDLSGDQE